MSRGKVVFRPVNLPGDHVCVDIFRRPDGTFGFDEFRRVRPPDRRPRRRAVGWLGAACPEEAAR
ncbi:MAG: hypothetical protein AAGE03_05175 [Pseudomonadota bacterium]